MSSILGVTLAASGLSQKILSDKSLRVKATLTIGDGTLTYPAGGIPVDKSLFQLRQDIRRMDFLDTTNAGAGEGYVYKFDMTNQTIRVYQAPASGPAALSEIPTSTALQTTIVVEVEGK